MDRTFESVGEILKYFLFQCDTELSFQFEQYVLVILYGLQSGLSVFHKTLGVSIQVFIESKSVKAASTLYSLFKNSFQNVSKV